MTPLKQWADALRAALVRAMYRGHVANAAERLLEQRVVADFLAPDVGRDYALTRHDKAGLVRRIRHTHASVQSATHWTYHVVLAGQILSIPPSVEGAVVECGCYKGASTANLSLVCERTGRTLYVCDSFQGLPEDDAVVHRYPHFQVQGQYEKGMYTGTYDEVRGNIRRFGALDACSFVPGFFSDTLHTVPAPVAFVFVDVDLVSSMRDCIVHLWPKLIEGGYFYTDDSADMEVVQLWFDTPWWREQFGCPAPGYVGSGCGLPLSIGNCTLGYAQKVADYTAAYGRVPWLRYPDPS
ncbi:MAG: class I SAM-dependent methyltransferase [Candidatus Hydrogenedentes bacterium]|nr:class I SAM-dependent methyltransferase [Candidatus Hydrogenedentota bacterium]